MRHRWYRGFTVVILVLLVSAALPAITTTVSAVSSSKPKEIVVVGSRIQTEDFDLHLDLVFTLFEDRSTAVGSVKFIYDRMHVQSDPGTHVLIPQSWSKIDNTQVGMLGGVQLELAHVVQQRKNRSAVEPVSATLMPDADFQCGETGRSSDTTTRSACEGTLLLAIWVPPLFGEERIFSITLGVEPPDHVYLILPAVQAARETSPPR